MEFFVEVNKDLDRTEILFVNFDKTKSSAIFTTADYTEVKRLLDWVNFCIRENTNV